MNQNSLVIEPKDVKVQVKSTSNNKVIVSATYRGHTYNVSLDLLEESANKEHLLIKKIINNLFQELGVDQQTESLSIETIKQKSKKDLVVSVKHKRKINRRLIEKVTQITKKTILNVCEKIELVKNFNRPILSKSNTLIRSNTLALQEYATLKRNSGSAEEFATDFANKKIVAQAIEKNKFSAAFRIIQNTLLASHIRIEEQVDITTACILLEIVRKNSGKQKLAQQFVNRFFESKLGIVGPEVENLFSFNSSSSVSEEKTEKNQGEVKDAQIRVESIDSLKSIIDNIEQIISGKKICNCKDVLSQLNQKLSKSDDQKKKMIFYFITQILSKKQGFDPSLTLKYKNINSLLKKYAQKQLRVRFSRFKYLENIKRNNETFKERLIEAQVALMVGVKPKSTGGGATGAQFLLSRSGDYLFVFKPSGEIHRDLLTRIVHATLQRYLPKNFETFRYAWITEALPMLLAKLLGTQAIVPPIKIGALSFQDKVLHGTFAWAEKNVSDLGKRAGIFRIKAPKEAKKLDDALKYNIDLVDDSQVTKAFFMNVLLGNVDLHRENFLIREKIGSENKKYDLFMIDTALSMPTQNFSGHKRFVFSKGNQNLDKKTFLNLAETLMKKKGEVVESVQRFYKIHGYTNKEKLKQMMNAFKERVEYLLFIKEKLEKNQEIEVPISLVAEVLNPKSKDINWKNYKDKLFSVKSSRSWYDSIFQFFYKIFRFLGLWHQDY